MSKKKKKKNGNQDTIYKIVLITAILDLIHGFIEIIIALINLIN